jgi:hypothetical protein
VDEDEHEDEHEHGAGGASFTPVVHRQLFASVNSSWKLIDAKEIPEEKR